MLISGRAYDISGSVGPLDFIEHQWLYTKFITLTLFCSRAWLGMCPSIIILCSPITISYLTNYFLSYPYKTAKHNEHKDNMYVRRYCQ